jgi:hypothetical protein
MHQGQAIHQDRHVVPGVSLPLVFLILVQHLQAVVVNVLLVQQINILARPVIPL